MKHAMNGHCIGHLMILISLAFGGGLGYLGLGSNKETRRLPTPPFIAKRL
jgi:hypothetical protein